MGNSAMGGLNKKKRRETVTPHRIAIFVLIREFFRLREHDSLILLPKRHIRDFAMLACRSIQGPDMPLREFQRMISSGRYTMYNQLILKFNETMEMIDTEGTGGLLNFVGELSKLVLRETDLVSKTPSALIHKNSVIGYYLRRLLVSFDKLTFSEVTSVMGAFKAYYAARIDVDCCFAPMADQDSDEFDNDELTRQQWPRRQAELFIAHQGALLNGNVEKAVSPKEMHRHIKNLLKSNPDLAEAHFLNYLNNLRVKEFCTAINSLYHCFDRSGTTDVKSAEEKRSFRYAALNLAVLYYNFGRREEALAALKEAIMLAQEANDNVCLQHALSWLYCLSNSNKDKLLEHSILKSLDLNLTYLVSLGIQSFVQYAGISGGTPKYIFETITRSDMVNCQHTYGDLTCNSYAQKAAMWQFYGKPEMSSVWSQLLLHHNSDSNSMSKTYVGEAVCQSICNVSNCLLLQGEYVKSYSVLVLASDRFPSEPICHIWKLCENVHAFTRSLHRQNWEEAEIAAHKMAVYDVWESRLRLAELHLRKGEFSYAQTCVSDILDSKNSSSLKLRVDYHMRTIILLGEIQYVSNYPNVVPPTSLNMCIAYVNDFHVDYLGAMVCLHLANVQLLMGLPAQALKLLDRCLMHVLTHGGCFDKARALVLFAKCKVANVGHLTEAQRRDVVVEAAQTLRKASDDFAKVEAYSRAKEALHLQALLYNEVNMTKERNKCALEYRLIEEEHPSDSVGSSVAFL